MLTFSACILSLVAFATAQLGQPMTDAERCSLVEQQGKACSPDACTTATCSVIPSAICLSDKCGCRARFWHMAVDPKSDSTEKKYVEVTDFCKAVGDIHAAQNFLKNVLTSDEKAADIVSENPALLQNVFKGLNQFNVDTWKIVVSYAKRLSEKKGTDATLRRYQFLLDLLKKTQQHIKTTVANDETILMLEDENGELFELSERRARPGRPGSSLTDKVNTGVGVGNLALSIWDKIKGRDVEFADFADVDLDGEISERRARPGRPGSSLTDKVNTGVGVGNLALSIWDKIKGRDVEFADFEDLEFDDELTERAKKPSKPTEPVQPKDKTSKTDKKQPVWIGHPQ